MIPSLRALVGMSTELEYFSTLLRRYVCFAIEHLSLANLNASYFAFPIFKQWRTTRCRYPTTITFVLYPMGSMTQACLSVTRCYCHILRKLHLEQYVPTDIFLSRSQKLSSVALYHRHFVYCIGHPKSTTTLLLYQKHRITSHHESKFQNSHLPLAQISLAYLGFADYLGSFGLLQRSSHTQSLFTTRTLSPVLHFRHPIRSNELKSASEAPGQPGHTPRNKMYWSLAYEA
jgi:hypothetical protein